MASLQERSGSYRFIFRHRGKQHFVTLGKVSHEEAKAKAAQVDYLLLRLKQGLITLPGGIGVVEFLTADGAPSPGQQILPKREPLNLAGFRDKYLETHRESLEESTLDTARLHFKHLVATLGPDFPIRELSMADLQRHIDRRAKVKARAGNKIGQATIRKEIVTLRTAWNWAAKMGIVGGKYPNDGLRFPKGEEKPPFQTVEEIRKRVEAGGITPPRVKELWESLYLRVPETTAMLAVVKDMAAYPWVYPLTCMAAHTGARRSELIRMQVADLDLEGGTVTIRENKRVKGKRSMRRAPLTPTLRAALDAWLAQHPGGNALFCHGGHVDRSKKRSRTTGHKSGPNRATSAKGRLLTVRSRRGEPGVGPLTASELHHHFKRTLGIGEWSIVRGLHVLRHSFISGLAAAGVDQRIIDDIVGHTSEDMRRRYRHLTPASKSQAVAAVFG